MTELACTCRPCKPKFPCRPGTCKCYFLQVQRVDCQVIDTDIHTPVRLCISVLKVFIISKPQSIHLISTRLHIMHCITCFQTHLSASTFSLFFFILAIARAVFKKVTSTLPQPDISCLYASGAHNSLVRVFIYLTHSPLG